jgi:F0F1-type ATP synthase epsilon subunit
LPHHHNFISLLSECELAVVTHAGTTRIKISGGIMHVKADQIVVFLNV